MSNVNYDNSYPLTRYLATSSVIAANPFSLIDVGCSGGINPFWRVFEPHLVVNAFDPMIEECARLRQAEQNPRARYHATFVGLPEGHPFLLARQQAVPAISYYFRPFSRSSCYRPRRPAPPSRPFSETNDWAAERLSTGRIGIDQFVNDENLDNVDFIKIDTDGSDLEVLNSGEATLRQHLVLGALCEFSFAGEPHRFSNAFANIDFFMREYGFLLYNFEFYRYSRAALPAPFLMPRESATIAGQPMVGDALYLRDGSALDFELIVGAPLSLSKKLKLLCLYEMFSLPDCAAEMVSRYGDELTAVVDRKRALGLLTPTVDGSQMDYDSYIDLFDTQRERFFP